MIAKYRGKSLKEKQWVYGSHIKSIISNKHFILLIAKDYEVDMFPIIPFAEMVVGVCEVNPETAGQFTDRQDDQKVELYTDDILAMRINTKFGPVNRIGVIKSEELGHCVVDFCDGITIGDGIGLEDVFLIGSCRKIGNIHDNPELVKGAK